MSKNTGSLIEQINKIHKNDINTRESDYSYSTADRYHKATSRFAEYLQENTNIQKFSSVKSNHLVSYAKYLIEDKGLMMSTVKNELSGIRAFHSNSDSKNRLLDNEGINKRFEKMGLEIRIDKRQIGGINRSWSNQEFQEFKKIANDLDNEKVAAMCSLAKDFGLRLKEIVDLNKNNITKALENGYLVVENGKGGQRREIPFFTIQQRATLLEVKNKMDDYSNTKKVFVEADSDFKKTYDTARNFVNNHKWKFQNEERMTNKEARALQSKDSYPMKSLSIHGLRHSFAKEYLNLLWEKNSHIVNKEERRSVCNTMLTEALGHHRGEVTKVYIDKMLQTLS